MWLANLFRGFQKPVHTASRPMTFRPTRTAGTGLQRGFDAAEMNRLVEDWFTFSSSADSEIQPRIERMRNRCRDLERNDDYVRQVGREVEANVVGHKGTTLCMKVLDSPATPKKKAEPDRWANFLIEAAWKKWGKRKNASITTTMSLRDIEALCVRRRFFDGEIFIRTIKGADNPFRFALQLIPAEFRALNYSREMPNGRCIHYGIEMDANRKPLAYYFLARASDTQGNYMFPGGVTQDGQYVRIEASEIIHYYFPERPEQTIGIPELVSAVMRLRQLKGYEDAEVVAARLQACMSGFFSQKEGEKFEGDGTDAQGATELEAEPGIFRSIGSQQFTAFNPTHPNGNYQAFRKGVLRGIASGIGVSYNTMANDLEGVNYSSLRTGALNEQELWMLLQVKHHEGLLDPVFEPWLSTAILTPEINLPFAKLEKFLAQSWFGRRWPWVDPFKDLQAVELALRIGMTSRRRELAEQGIDIEELDEEIEEEQDKKEKLGLMYGSEPTPEPVTEPKDPEKTEEEPEEEDA